MRAGALTDVGEFEVQERERPEPQAGEVPQRSVPAASA